MIVTEETWGTIPLLHVHTIDMNEHTPVVIFLHGFLSAKEHNLHYAYQLVKKGIRVILPDAKLHGDRSEALNEMQLNLQFWEIVLQSIHEVEQLYMHLKESKLFSSGKIGIAGTSMGAIVTSGSLKRYDWIHTAAICMGAPNFVELGQYQLDRLEAQGLSWPMSDEEIVKSNALLASYSIAETPEKFAGKPVLFWHGKQDATIPFKNTYTFYLKLRSFYEKQPELLNIIVDNQAGHSVSREGVLAATNWLAQHLAE
ncbi:MAG: prolyl oligopeptidase family serine peptidase [Lysinibacillus sp.]